MAQNHEALHGFTYRDCALQLREAAGGGESDTDDDEREEALQFVQLVLPGLARLATLLADEACGAADLDGQMAQIDDLDDEQYDVMQDYIKVLTDLRLRGVLPTPPKVSRADLGLPVPVMEMPVTEMKKPQLMRLAEERDLHKSGTKEELIDRLLYDVPKPAKPAKRAKRAKAPPEPPPVGWKAVKHTSPSGGKSWTTFQGPNGETARSRADIKSIAAGELTTQEAWEAKQRQSKE